MITVSNVSVQFGKRVLFNDVNLKFTSGNCYGIIGANGAGKSTFLRTISGDLDPTTGSIMLGPGERLSVLSQDHFKWDAYTVMDTVMMGHTVLWDIMKQREELYAKEDFTDEDGLKVSELEEKFAELDGWNAESDAAALLSGLGIKEDKHYVLMGELNNKEKVRVMLAQALYGNPDNLLLDEPTNYLDVEHIEWLTKFLQNYEHAFILISHDIPFLNKVVNVIYHLENCELTRYSGDYDKFQEMYAIYQSQKAAAYERQQQEVAKLEDFIARNKARVATTNMAKSRQRKLDKMEMIEKPREKLKPTFKFTEARTPSRFIVEAKDLVLGYDSPLTRPVTFNLERGQKIAIRGVNGLGKTTLLKTILGIIPPVSGKVELGEFLEPGYFEQEEREKNENTALDDVWNEYPGLTNYEVRAALAGCGLTNEHITSKVFVLSGGEAAKVRLCKLMLKDVNWLVLDEPTNHLDVDAKDELKRALKEFKGSVLLVSHEPEFYEDWVDKVWNIEDWTTKII